MISPEESPISQLRVLVWMGWDTKGEKERAGVWMGEGRGGRTEEDVGGSKERKTNLSNHPGLVSTRTVESCICNDRNEASLR